MFKEKRNIDYSAHDIGAYGFLYVAVVKFKGNGFAVIVVSAYLVNHGIVGIDIFPKTKLRFTVQKNHFLYVHNVGAYQIYHIAIGHALCGVVNGNVCVVLIPAPIFLPGKVVAEKTAVGSPCELCVKLFELFIVPVHPADIAGLFYFSRNLGVFDGIGHFV